MPQPFLDPETFYQCDRCTACCRWAGDVRVSEGEVERIADYLGIERGEFIQDHTRLDMNRSGLSLLENPDHSCSMLVDGGCKIHEVKPEQCKGFPNTWNFPGWRKECQAKPIPMSEAVKRGLA